MAQAPIDWAVAELDDVPDSKIDSAPVWWPHLFDAKSALGQLPFLPPSRALAILKTRECELCHKGGVKAPPRNGLLL